MGTYAGRDRARAALVSLAGGTPDSESFRHEAVAILHRAIGVDGWGWLLTDPGARLPVHVSGENRVVDQALRRLFQMLPQAWNEPGGPGNRPAPKGFATSGPVTTLAAVTGGDLRRDLSWREVLGPAGVGDKMRIQLNAGGACWALVHLHRDSSRTYYSEQDVEFAAAVAPLLAPRVQADLRVPGPRGADPAPEPGTIILAQDQSMLAATEQAWRWIDRLGIPGPNPAEPLPPPVYVLAAHVAASPQRRSARVRLRAADGTWMAIRAAALTTGPQAAAGYAITLEAAPADDLAPLLMRAWGLTRREREVARLVIDGLSTEDIATTLFISVHTARDHVRTMFGKVGVSRRQDLAATLTGRTPSPVSRWVTRT
jgi:DNA-binding CsgD family transcriptional regulator